MTCTVTVVELVVHPFGEGKTLADVVWTERFADTVTLHIVVVTMHREQWFAVDLPMPGTV